MDTAEARITPTGEAGGPVYDAFLSYSHAADELLAPRLQSGLQRFAKPWWKRRALRIFRDEASLSANPHLWSSITDALDESGWFVLLLSPEAAESEWVNREVAYWLEHKDPDRIIPVLTEGDFTWYDNDFISDAAPPALVGAFSDEPRWVDLRFADSEEQLDLNNPTFSAAIADIASPIRGVPKDELESEEVRQHRRTVRTAWVAAGVVLVLAIAASGAAIYAVDQQNRANDLAQEEALARRDADVQRQAAEESAAEADAAAARADDEAARAGEAEKIARGEALAQASLVASEQDVDRSLLLALAGFDASNTPTTLDALRRALAGHDAIGAMEWPVERVAVPALPHALSSDGTVLAAAIHTGQPGPVEVELWRVGKDSAQWTTKLSDDASLGAFGSIYFDGTDRIIAVATSVTGEESEVAGYGIYLLAAEDGSVQEFIQLDACDYFARPIRPLDGGPVVSMVLEGGCEAGRIDVSVLDLSTGARAYVATHQVSWPFGAYASPDGQMVAIGGDEPARLYDVASGAVIREFSEFPLSVLSADASRIAVGGDPAVIRDVETGELLSVLQSGGKDLLDIGWGPDDKILYGLTPRGGEVFIFDAETGVPLHVFYPPSSPWGGSFAAEGSMLSTSTSEERIVRFWSIPSGTSGELPSMVTGSPIDAWDSIARLATSSDFLFVPFGGGDWADPGGYRMFDRTSLELIRAGDAWAASMSGDGELIAEQPIVDEGVTTPSGVEGALLVGPIRIVDAETGEVVVELEGCSWYALPGEINPEPAGGCAYKDLDRAAQFAFSKDRTLVAASTWDWSVAVWDASTGALLWRSPPINPNFQPSGPLALSPDGALLAWTGNPDAGYADVVDARTGEAVFDSGIVQNGWSATFDSSGDTLYVGFGESVFVYDTATWTSTSFATDHGNSIRHVLLDEDNERLFTVGTDDAVRVWNLNTFEKLDEMHVTGPLENGLYGVTLLDNTTIAVYGGISGQEKELLLFTLDPDVLTEHALAKITRGFSEEECATYRVKPCPTTVDAARSQFG